MKSPTPFSPGYPEALALLAGGSFGWMLLQWLRPLHLPALPAVPTGLAVGTFLLLSVAVGARFRDHAWIRFLGGVPFALTSLAFLGLTSLLGTIFLQNPSTQDAESLGRWWPWLQRAGLTDIYRAPYFAGQYLALLLCLGVAAGRRAWPLNTSNLIFLANHLGLALAMAGAFWGALCSQSGHLRLIQGEATGRIELERGGLAQFNQNLELQHFTVEPFGLELMVAQKVGDAFKPLRKARNLPFLETGQSFQTLGWTIQCEEALPQAQFGVALEARADGPLAMELSIRRDGSSFSMPLSPVFGMRRLPGGLVAMLTEATPENWEERLEVLRKSCRSLEGPALAFLSDGSKMLRLFRSLDGSIEECSGLQTLEPLRLLNLEFHPGPIQRALPRGRYLPLSGLDPRPTGAALIRAQKPGKPEIRGWISAGPEDRLSLELETGVHLVLQTPQPKAFRSTLSAGGRIQTLSVNRPIRHEGWSLSQSGYEVLPDGRPISVILAVKDPATSSVFAGLGLLLLGVFLRLWRGLMPGEEAL